MVSQSGHSDATTGGIRIRVAAQYLPDQSLPERSQFVFAYRVEICNVGTDVATLRSRRWVITDAEGRKEVVEGPGVVGEQPCLGPGDTHTYMSGSHLRTEWGTMEGHFVMEREDESTYEAEVGRFFLAKTVDPISSQG